MAPADDSLPNIDPGLFDRPSSQHLAGVRARPMYRAPPRVGLLRERSRSRLPSLKPSACNRRLVDVMEEWVKCALPTRDVAPCRFDRRSECREGAEALSRQVNQPTF